MKIVHLTSVHPRYDTRIFLKMCSSLAAAGYQVSLVVADGKGDETKNCIDIFDVGRSFGRVDRILSVTRKVFHKAIELDAALYHIHDPELLPIGLNLKQLGKKVIFDPHEDVPRQMLYKPYLNKPTRWVIAQSLSMLETWTCKQLDGIIAATPFIRDKFLKINPTSIDINNYPILGELSKKDIDWTHKKPQICYVGGIGSIRGIREMVKAMELVKSKARLALGGQFTEEDVEKDVKGYKGWSMVDALGFLDREQVGNVLTQSVAGLVTLHPIINYLDSLPVKMFEYMSAGIPVIASDFPLWREIIEGNQCGICVDPLKPKKIAKAIDALIENPVMAEEMGSNGRRAVEEKYNWKNEEKKLLKVYTTILD